MPDWTRIGVGSDPINAKNACSDIKCKSQSYDSTEVMRNIGKRSAEHSFAADSMQTKIVVQMSPVMVKLHKNSLNNSAIRILHFISLCVKILLL